ncbi:hypothetical protein A9K71_23425 [Mesorhizobium sp. WSM3873]|nr:hypothetical protein A9K71_23425 [Mesorhizobium sp. WSM3873]
MSYAAVRYFGDRFQPVLRDNPLVRFGVAADAILRRVSPRRQGTSDTVDFAGLWTDAETALQPDRLSDVKKARRGSVLDGSCFALHEGGHGCLRSLSSAASSNAGSICTICSLDPLKEIAGR